MASSVATGAASPARTAGPPRSLRVWGVLVLVAFLLTSLVGGSLALESSYLLVTLASHIGLAVVTLAIAGYAASAVGPAYRTAPRFGARLAALSALGGVIAGTVFLLAGQNPVALYAMEAFAGLGLVGAILMIAFGAAAGARPVPDGAP